MRLFARTPIAKKERFFFIPARFDPSIDPEKGYRTQANFHSASMLVLDFDNGSLSPEKFVEMFWTKAGRGQKRSFVICNTFSRSPDEPNRFRAILFFTTPARSIAEYQAVFDSCDREDRGGGLSRGRDGHRHDLKKRRATLLHSRHEPGPSRPRLLRALWDRDEGHRPLRHRPLGLPEDSANTANPRTSPAIIHRRRWPSPELSDMKRKLMGMAEGRHDLFFDFACKTAIHFKDKAKVAKELYDVAGSDAKLRGKVKPALNSLRKYRLI